MAVPEVSSSVPLSRLPFSDTYIGRLPQEININIFKYFSSLELLTVIPLVCKGCKALSEDWQLRKIHALYEMRVLHLNPATDLMGPTIPREFYVRSFGLINFLNLHKLQQGFFDYCLPGFYLTLEENKTTFFIYLKGNQLLKWDPITQAPPQVLYEHPSPAESLELKQIVTLNKITKEECNDPSFYTTSQEQITYILCRTVQNGSCTSLLFLDPSNGSCAHTLSVSYQRINKVYPFEYLEKNYLLIHRDEDAFDVWDLEQKQMLHTLPVAQRRTHLSEGLVQQFISKQGGVAASQDYACVAIVHPEKTLSVYDLMTNQKIFQTPPGVLHLTVAKDYVTNETSLLTTRLDSDVAIGIRNTANWTAYPDISLFPYKGASIIFTRSIDDNDFLFANGSAPVDGNPEYVSAMHVFDVSKNSLVVKFPYHRIPGRPTDLLLFRIKHHYLIFNDLDSKGNNIKIFDLDSEKDPTTSLIPCLKEIKIPREKILENGYKITLEFIRFGKNMGVPYLIYNVCLGSSLSTADQRVSVGTAIFDLGSTLPETRKQFPRDVEKKMLDPQFVVQLASLVQQPVKLTQSQLDWMQLNEKFKKLDDNAKSIKHINRQIQLIFSFFNYIFWVLVGAMVYKAIRKIASKIRSKA